MHILCTPRISAEGNAGIFQVAESTHSLFNREPDSFRANYAEKRLFHGKREKKLEDFESFLKTDSSLPTWGILLSNDGDISKTRPDRSGGGARKTHRAPRGVTTWMIDKLLYEDEG